MIEFPSPNVSHRGDLHEIPLSTGSSIYDGLDRVVAMVFVIHDDVVVHEFVVSHCCLFCIAVSISCVLLLVVVDDDWDRHGIALSKRGVFCTNMTKIATAIVSSKRILITRKRIFMLSNIIKVCLIIIFLFFLSIFLQ
jgi:hypothetical protein